MADDSGKRRKKPKGRKGGAGKGRAKKRSRPCSKQGVLAALNHRLRRQVLRRLHRSKKPMSPAELSRMVDVRVTNLSYHVDILKKYCVVRFVDEQPVRGAMEHFYESKVADNPIVQAILEETEAEDEGKA